jgi:Zn ribbon nucleic-acid-binding protein
MDCPRCEYKDYVITSVNYLFGGKDENICTCEKCGYKWKSFDYEIEKLIQKDKIERINEGFNSLPLEQKSSDR